MKHLENFFRTNAWIYVTFALLNLIANGWRSISWIPWLLMAFGLSVVDGRERSRWHSPTYVVTVLLAAALLLYRAIYHSK